MSHISEVGCRGQLTENVSSTKKRLEKWHFWVTSHVSQRQNSKKVFKQNGDYTITRQWADIYIWNSPVPKACFKSFPEKCILKFNMSDWLWQNLEDPLLLLLLNYLVLKVVTHGTCAMVDSLKKRIWQTQVWDGYELTNKGVCSRVAHHALSTCGFHYCEYGLFTYKPCWINQFARFTECITPRLIIPHNIMSSSH